MSIRVRRAARSVAAVALGNLSALHLLWATGCAWPARDRGALADAVGGFKKLPGSGPCVAVAALLGVATLSVGGAPERFARIGKLGSAITALVLFSRGAIGLAGVMPNDRRSIVFAALNRRVYSPVCLALAVLALAGVSSDA